jgi:SHS2 domain-containing protein
MFAGGLGSTMDRQCGGEKQSEELSQSKGRTRRQSERRWAMGDWEHFAHGADIGIRGWGATLDEAFAHAGMALTAVVTDPALVRPAEAVRIECRVADPELLFCEWLNSLVFNMATRRMLFSRFDVHLSGDRLEGEAWGEPVDVPRHAPAVEVKGATLTELAVRQQPDGRWLAQCVLDV